MSDNEDIPPSVSGIGERDNKPDDGPGLLGRLLYVATGRWTLGELLSDPTDSPSERYYGHRRR